jgi:hypothetical protein
MDMRKVLFPLVMGLTLAAAEPPRFTEHTVATGLRGGYQVVVADLNRDGKPDLIGLASGLPELVWFENPGWQRHVIVGGQSRMINCVPVPGTDGIPDIVLATGFSNIAKDSSGEVFVLRHNGDPREPWTATEIDRLPTSHRLRLADIDGSGKPVVVNAPLTGAKAGPPDFREPVPLVYYRPGEWKRQLISEENSGVMHGILVLDWDGDRRDEILTASFGGIHLFKMGKDRRWTRTEIAKGDPAPWPKSGSSDLAVGRLAKNRFIASIEPWHGNQVAVYRQSGAAWERQAIDDSLVDGHTIAAADFNRDGLDEIVGGFRGRPYNLYLYTAAGAAGDRWSRQMLDEGGMGAAACAVVDLNADGRPDLACIGSATANLKWYENR